MAILTNYRNNVSGNPVSQGLGNSIQNQVSRMRNYTPQPSVSPPPPITPANPANNYMRGYGGVLPVSRGMTYGQYLANRAANPNPAPTTGPMGMPLENWNRKYTFNTGSGLVTSPNGLKELNPRDMQTWLTRQQSNQPPPGQAPQPISGLTQMDWTKDPNYQAPTTPSPGPDYVWMPTKTMSTASIPPHVSNFDWKWVYKGPKPMPTL